MILFHGSDRIIERPDILHSRKEVDFGAGFYTTPIEKQARDWCKKFIRRGMKGIVSVYNFDGAALRIYSARKFETVELYFEGLISKSAAIGRLAMENPNLQICFRSQEVLDHYLKFERSFEV